MDQNCLSCHGEIRHQLREERGLHPRVGDKACASCHPDHAGREFELIYWGKQGQSAFDHAEAGWRLEGKHADAECRSCHTSRFQKGAVTALIKRTPVSESWLGLQTECLACHPDQHQGGFGTGCASCHGTSSWTQLARTGSFPHHLTRYPLKGRHASLECAACHDPVKAWGKKPAFERCASCHADSHAGTATLAGKPVDCASCHDEQGFRTSTLTVSFHDRTEYPLTGKHKSVACRSCHTKPKGGMTAKLGTAGVVMHPAHNACTSCHAGAHADQLEGRKDGGACNSCHSVEGWRPSTFTVSDHAGLDFPLEGGHLETGCRSCHGPKRPGLPPLPGKGITGTARVMLALRSSECQDCHVDAHRGRFTGDTARPASDCRSCHTTETFHVALVDADFHDRFTFPLAGAHRAVPCFLCHGELDHSPAASTLLLAGARVPELPFAPLGSECEACHVDPHGGQFTGGEGARPCSSCHDESTFRPAVRFQHDRDARFSLAGAHDQVPCRKCHPAGREKDGRQQVLYRPLAADCRSCHGA